ncbi:hypothetical protein IJG01_00410 [Candidatus Saccharibacteria bacterium]|nr:hypothetical protein [Candidatus Saccharibacteria bacterium]
MAEGSKQPTVSPPKLVQRRANRSSSFRSGRTIGEKRERLETANERAAARKKDKFRQVTRIVFTVFGFIALAGILVILGTQFLHKDLAPPEVAQISAETTPEATIEIIDEDATSGNHITGRMRTYISQAEQDLRDLGYHPTKAVIPTGSIREVDLYLDGYSGFAKFIIDRNSAESAEDLDRVIRYLAGINVQDFSYIDVRIEGKAYWK